MPKVNIYLPDDLAEAVKDSGVPLSAVCQRALEQAVRRVTQIREIVSGPASAIGTTDPPPVNFTARAMRMLESARDTALCSGLAGAGTGHLLAQLAEDDHSLAMRVLNALEISSQQIRSELTRREQADAESAASRPAEGGAAAATEAALDGQAATALELAAIESSGLGHGYIGSEHLLLGLIAEPEGVAGRALRSLGADLRVTRRMVAAALAGWSARAESQQHSARTAAGTAGAAANPGPADDQIAAAIRTELAPVLSRIERLEARLA